MIVVWIVLYILAGVVAYGIFVNSISGGDDDGFAFFLAAIWTVSVPVLGALYLLLFPAKYLYLAGKRLGLLISRLPPP